MPQNYTGSTTGIAARQNATISEPVGTDVRNSASVRAPLEKLADFCQYLMQKAGLLDVASTWTAKQTLSGGAGGLPLPTQPADAATMSFAEDLIVTLKAFANTWAGKQTFGYGIEVSDGHFDLTLAGSPQTVGKRNGNFRIGTWDNNEVQFIRNNTIAGSIQEGGDWWFGGHKLKNLAAPAAGSDEAATALYAEAMRDAAKAYADGKIPLINTVAVASVTAGGSTFVRGFSGMTRTGLNGNEYRFAFAAVQPDTNYAVFCQGRNPDPYSFEIIKETGQVRIVVTQAGAFDTSAEIDVRVER
jgi:hypothetical protein